jgi:hypothetical protein
LAAKFNLALLLLSPLAGTIAERMHIRSLLNYTSFGRAFVYAVLLPAAWLFLDSDIIITPPASGQTIFFFLFLITVFLDGAIVSFAAIGDIDNGGTVLVDKTYNLNMDGDTIVYLNTVHAGSLDAAIVLFAPLAATGTLYLSQYLNTLHSDQQHQAQLTSSALMGTISSVFFLASLVSILYYTAYMPAGKNNDWQDTDIHQDIFGSKRPAGLLTDPNQLPNDEITEEQEMGVCESMFEGFKLVWRNTKIRYRVIFFALEVAMEDATISLLITAFASDILAPTGSLQYSYGNLWAAAMTACGKFGGVIAAMLMNRYFKIDENDSYSTFRPLFWFQGIGSFFALGLPLTYSLRLYAAAHYKEDIVFWNNLSTALAFAGVFFFFFFSNFAKIGFQTLLQGLAANVKDEHGDDAAASGRIWGIVAACVTTTDSLVLMGMSSILMATTLEKGLWICAGIIVLHGIIEMAFGPCLILQSDE